MAPRRMPWQCVVILEVTAETARETYSAREARSRRSTACGRGTEAIAVGCNAGSGHRAGTDQRLAFKIEVGVGVGTDAAVTKGTLEFAFRLAIAVLFGRRRRRTELFGLAEACRGRQVTSTAPDATGTELTLKAEVCGMCGCCKQYSNRSNENLLHAILPLNDAPNRHTPLPMSNHGEKAVPPTGTRGPSWTARSWPAARPSPAGHCRRDH